LAFGTRIAITIGIGKSKVKMLIVDNFISRENQKILLDYVCSNKLPYRIYPTHIFSENDVLQGKVHAPDQLSHFLYMHGEPEASGHVKILRPIFDAIQRRVGEITMFRAKVNITTPHPQFMGYEPQVPHTDMAYDDGRKIPHHVCLYYINDSDGPTYFFNEKYELLDAVEPKMGRGVIFNGDKLHSGSNPVKNPFRFALNINFRKGRDQTP
jgi:hypothetical protein